jgi:hypothetical protein
MIDMWRDPENALRGGGMKMPRSAPKPVYTSGYRICPTCGAENPNPTYHSTSGEVHCPRCLPAPTATETRAAALEQEVARLRQAIRDKCERCGASANVCEHNVLLSPGGWLCCPLYQVSGMVDCRGAGEETDRA